MIQKFGPNNGQHRFNSVSCRQVVRKFKNLRGMANDKYDTW